MTNEPNEPTDDDLENIEIKEAGTEEKIAFIEAIKNGKVEFAPGAEEQMIQSGLTLDDILEMITKDVKSSNN